MKSKLKIRQVLLSLALTASAMAHAQASFNIVVAPPEPLYEVAPAMQPGFVWAPGYWAWNFDRHIWVRGRTMVQRAGYRWEPDRWEQHGDAYNRQPGRWERNAVARHDNGFRNQGDANRVRQNERKDERREGR
jgi:hypothetical protein